MIASLDLRMTSAKVYIEFEGTVEHDGAPLRSVKGDMAIDDIMLTSSGTCQDLDSMFDFHHGYKYQIGHVTTFSQHNFSLEFPEILSQHYIWYH